MELHRTAHKLFLFFMFLVCAIAVVSFARSRVQASLSIGDATTSSGSLINSTTNSLDTTYKTTTSPTISNTYPTTSTSPVATTNPTATTSPTPATSSTTTNTTTTEQPKTTTTASNTISPEDSINAATVTTNLILTGSAGTSSTDTKTQIDETKQTVTASTSPTTTSSDSTVVEKNDQVGAPVSSTKMIEVTVDPTAKITNISLPEKNYQVQTFSQPTVVKAADLPEEKNPKTSGTVAADLSIKNVQLITKYDGQKTVLFEGKAAPNSAFNIFIFSKDPIIMTVVADQNGNWSYELSKDLADGQHEVFVAVTEKSGRVISKAEPIAFVKTAQAATIIPVSELDENKSPMQRSTASYIMVAIAIMSVCLAIALALIGILTHKYKTDETTF